MTLADKIVVLKDGRIMQVGTPRELYEKPQNLFVAQFIGSPCMNVMRFAPEGDLSELAKDRLNERAKSVEKLGVRPEHIELVDKSDAHCSGVVEVVEYLRSDTFLYVNCGALGTLTVRTADVGRDVKNTVIHLKFSPQNVHFFDQDDQSLNS